MPRSVDPAADGGLRGAGYAALMAPGWHSSPDSRVSCARELCDSQQPLLPYVVGWQRGQWFACDANLFLQGCNQVIA